MASTALRALGSGLIGAGVVNVLNEAARRTLPQAPRLDVLGQRALARGARLLGRRPPRRGRPRFLAALAGDVLANTLFFSLVGGGRRMPWARGTLLGTAAGLGALVLPPTLGLGRRIVRGTPARSAMTAGWYLAGGLAAAAAARLLARRGEA